MITENMGVELLVTDDAAAHKLITEQYELDEQAGYTRTTVQERVEWTEKVIEGYFAVNGEQPSESVLERLGSYILKEDYEDKRKNKTKLVEYNFHSERQTRTRTKEKEYAVEDVHPTDGVIGFRKEITVDKFGEQVSARTAVRDYNVPNTTKGY